MLFPSGSGNHPYGDESAIRTTKCISLGRPLFPVFGTIFYCSRKMSYMFYGDRQRSENPRDFLYHFEEHLASLPNPSESRKCEHFYLHCRSGFNAEEWYENFEKNSPSIITSWSTLCKHFCVKWLGASTDILLEIPKEKPVTSTQLCTATNPSCEMNTTTTITIPV